MRKTGKVLVRKMADHVHDFLRDKSDSDLRMIRKRLRGLTTTNCGWDAYALRTGWLEIIKTHLDSRRIEKRNSRKRRAA